MPRLSTFDNRRLPTAQFQMEKAEEETSVTSPGMIIQHHDLEFSLKSSSCFCRGSGLSGDYTSASSFIEIGHCPGYRLRRALRERRLDLNGSPKNSRSTSQTRPFRPPVAHFVRPR